MFIVNNMKTTTRKINQKSREREGERENYKNILTNKGKRQNNDYLTIDV